MSEQSKHARKEALDRSENALKKTTAFLSLLAMTGSNDSAIGIHDFISEVIVPTLAKIEESRE